MLKIKCHTCGRNAKLIGSGGEKSPFSSREYEAYIAGAHSRDEEINLLRNILQSKQEQSQEHIIELQKEINKLRNPWISVEEQLPEHKKPIIFKCADKVYGGWYNKEMKEFQTKAPDGTNWTMDNIKSWYYQI